METKCALHDVKYNFNKFEPAPEFLIPLCDSRPASHPGFLVLIPGCSFSCFLLLIGVMYELYLVPCAHVRCRIYIPRFLVLYYCSCPVRTVPVSLHGPGSYIELFISSGVVLLFLIGCPYTNCIWFFVL